MMHFFLADDSHRTDGLVLRLSKTDRKSPSDWPKHKSRDGGSKPWDFCHVFLGHHLSTSLHDRICPQAYAFFYRDLAHVWMIRVRVSTVIFLGPPSRLITAKHSKIYMYACVRVRNSRPLFMCAGVQLCVMYIYYKWCHGWTELPCFHVP